MKQTVMFFSILFTVLGSLTLLADARAGVEAPLVVDRAPSRLQPAAELPAEWQWKREPVRFDHMFMSRDASARRLDLGRESY